VRLVWTDEALGQLRVIRDFAPVQAERIVSAVEWLAHGPFPSMCPPLRDHSTEHVFVIVNTHHSVVYEIDGDEFLVLTVRDDRQRRTPRP